MNEITFTNVDKALVPSKQLATSFYMSNRIFAEYRDDIELRPLTISNLLYTSIRNEGKSLYFCLIRLLYKCGFIDIGERECFNWKHLTLNCVFTLKKRKKYIDNIQYTEGLRKYV